MVQHFWLIQVYLLFLLLAKLKLPPYHHHDEMIEYMKKLVELDYNSIKTIYIDY